MALAGYTNLMMMLMSSSSSSSLFVEYRTEIECYVDVGAATCTRTAVW